MVKIRGYSIEIQVQFKSEERLIACALLVHFFLYASSPVSLKGYRKRKKTKMKITQGISKRN